MPELPDLLYVRDTLRRSVVNRAVAALEVRQPIVLRNTLPDPAELALRALTITGIEVRGPFLVFTFGATLDLVVNLMLAGRVQHQRKPDKAVGYICLTFRLDDGTKLNICDEQKMAKVYLVHRGAYSSIPQFETLGIDILSSSFTLESFRSLTTAHGRKQVRAFINTHTLLSSIGNAYADEILFEARIHPKTFVGSLTPDEVDRLYAAINSIIRWGTAIVAEARQPVHVKVRDHMKVRNRKGLPCPRCGSLVRREGVRGYDVFFCPQCQPARRATFIDWGKQERPKGGAGS